MSVCILLGGVSYLGALSANLAVRTRDAAAVQAVQPMAFQLIFLTSAYQTTDYIDSRVLRTIIVLNPAEQVMRPMRKLMLSGHDWGDIAVGLRNYRSVYG